jgi:ankyrin repeat protein
VTTRPNQALARAALRGDVAKLDELVAAGANPRLVVGLDRWSLLHEVLVLVSPQYTASVPVLARLLELGLDVDAADRRGWTPLHFAVRARHLGAVRLLLDAGAAVDPVNADGATPLRLTLERRRCPAALVQLLLERGADPDHRSPAGVSVRSLAATVCHGEDLPLRALLGVDPSAG